MKYYVLESSFNNWHIDIVNLIDPNQTRAKIEQ